MNARTRAKRELARVAPGGRFVSAPNRAGTAWFVSAWTRDRRLIVTCRGTNAEAAWGTAANILAKLMPGERPVTDAFAGLPVPEPRPAKID